MDLKLKGWAYGSLFSLLVFGAFPFNSQAQEKEGAVFANRILDRDVYDAGQELIGEVDDVIIRRSGKIKKLTVEFGGFYDIGDKLVALPIRVFQMKDGKVALELTEQQLQRKPEFNYYTAGLRPEYYYRARPYAGWYHFPRPRYYHGPNEPNPPMELYEWAFSPSRFLASVLMNRRLINEQGKNLGMLEDLMIDRDSNKVEKIIVSSVDILGENVYAALPYEPLGFTVYGLVYDMMPGELKNLIYAYEP